MGKKIIAFFLLFQFLIVGCSSQTGKAATVVEDYLKALVNEDSIELSNLICEEFEPQAKLELDSFIGVTASLKDLNCESTESGDTHAIVVCTGKIIATYNNELQELDISRRIFQVNKVNSDWLVCGYQ